MPEWINRIYTDNDIRNATIFGALLSFLIITLGFGVGSYTTGGQLPLFENQVVKYLTFVFLGYAAGYNWGQTKIKSKLQFYFLGSFLAPFLLVTLGFVILNVDYISTSLLCLSFACAFIYAPSKLSDEPTMFIVVLNYFSKFVPNFALLAVSISGYALPAISITDGLVNYSISLIISLIVLILSAFIENAVSEVRHQDPYRI